MKNYRYRHMALYRNRRISTSEVRCSLQVSQRIVPFSKRSSSESFTSDIATMFHSINFDSNSAIPLRSIILLLTDHEQVQIRIVLERADYKKYNTEIFSDPAIKAGLPRLDWVFTQDIFPRANSSSPIVKSSHYEEDFYKSMKKAYGCTSLAVDYCWVLDAESFFIRKISFRTMVGEFVRDPHLLVSSMKRVGDLYSIETRKALGMYDVSSDRLGSMSRSK